MMREVSIYTATTIRGPWKADGWIAYTLEYYPDGKKYPETLTDYEAVSELTGNRAALEALIRGITRIRENCILTIYTDSEYLYQGFAGQENVTRWIKSGWLTSKGTEVKNADLWKKLVKGLQGNIYQFYLHENNAYMPWMQEELEELKDGRATLEIIKNKHKRKGN